MRAEGWATGTTNVPTGTVRAPAFKASSARRTSMPFATRTSAKRVARDGSAPGRAAVK